MEGRVKSRISEKTYITNLEKLEEEDVDETSELYMIPISGHKIMVAPGKTIMADGIAHCYVYVIKNEKVLCKLGVYEKKTETMPLFFDISTFPEGSFCLFEEFEKNPTKLLDFEMIEHEAEPESESESESKFAVETKGQNVFDFLIEEFAKIPNKKERLKSAYKSLFSTYETKKSIEKYKKFKPILKSISEAGKEAEPTDAFIQTLKTNSQDKPVFVMTLLALQRIFFIEFTFVTEYEMADERDEYIKMKEDWPISNATKDLEVDVNTYAILDPNFIPKKTNDFVEAEEAEPEAVQEPEEPVSEAVLEEPVPEEPLSQFTSPKTKSRPKPNSVSEPLTQLSKPKSKVKPTSVSESEEPLAQLSKTKTKPSTIFKPDSRSMSVTEPASEPMKVKKSTMPKKSEKESTEIPELAASVSKLKESKPSTPKESVKTNVPVTLKQSRSIPKVKTQQSNK